MRYACTSSEPGPPIVFLAGGPGLPATSLLRIPAYDRLFQTLRAAGDVLVLDPRGCGLSEPSLVCVPNEPLPPDAYATEAGARRILARRLASCAELLRRRGTRPEAYHTRAIAEDVEALRRGIGAAKIDLLAYSYGTELAQEILRQSGDHVARVVLAGTRGTDQAWRLPSVFEFQFRRLGRVVERRPEYAAAWGDPIALLGTLAESLDAAPRSVPIVDSRSGRTVELRITGTALRMVVQTDLADEVGFALLPATLATLAAGDDTLFASRIERIYNGQSTMVNLVAAAVDCASGADPGRVARIARESLEGVVGGAQSLMQDSALCGGLGAADLGSGYRERVYSAVPTLFLSGSLDAVTPSFQAEDVRWGFPNGIHLVVANGWHELLPAPEVQEVVAAFFEGEDVAWRRITLPPPRILSVSEAKSFVESRR